MSIDLRLPNISGATDSEKISQIAKYLFQLTEQLNYSLNTIEDGMTRTDAERNASVLNGASVSETERLSETYATVKSMIIKSADFISAIETEIGTNLSGDFVASSVFGTYKETTNANITANSHNITQLFDYTSNLRSDYGSADVENKSYVKTGLLYYNGIQPVYGVGIGLLTENASDGTETINRSNLATTFTGNEIAFWGNDSKIAYITPTQIYFPNGTLSAENATISGSITATSGVLGGCSIVNGALQIPAANITGTLTIGKLPSTVAQKSDIPTVPTKTSDLTNDSNFVTSADIPTKTSELTNDSDFVTDADIPTKTSDLVNDNHFITNSDIPDVSGFQTSQQVQTILNNRLTEEGYVKSSNMTEIVEGLVSADYVVGLGCAFNQGSIGGWDISQNSISKTIVAGVMSSYEGSTFTAGMTTGATDGTPESHNAFYVSKDGQYQFAVGYDGFLLSNNAQITGTVNAKNGTFGNSTNNFYIGTGVSGNGACLYTGAFHSNLPWIGSAYDPNNRDVYIGSNGIYIYSDGTKTNSHGATIAKGLFAVSGSNIHSAGNVRGNEYSAIDYTNTGITFLYSASKDFTVTSATYSGTNSNVLAQITIRPNDLYVTGSIIGNSSGAVVSDRNKKNSISDIGDKYDLFFDCLSPKCYKYNDGKSGRVHTGFVSQEVRDALYDADMTSDDFAGFIKTEDEDGNEMFALRYEEFIALNTSQIQKLKARVTELEEKIRRMENVV